MEQLEKIRLQLKNTRRTFAQKSVSSKETNEFWDLTKEMLDKELNRILKITKSK